MATSAKSAAEKIETPVASTTEQITLPPKLVAVIKDVLTGLTDEHGKTAKKDEAVKALAERLGPGTDIKTAESALNLALFTNSVPGFESKRATGIGRVGVKPKRGPRAGTAEGKEKANPLDELNESFFTEAAQALNMISKLPNKTTIHTYEVLDRMRSVFKWPAEILGPENHRLLNLAISQGRIQGYKIQRGRNGGIVQMTEEEKKAQQSALGTEIPELEIPEKSLKKEEVGKESPVEEKTLKPKKGKAA